VISGLGKALQKKGHLVEIILPKYDCMQHNQINNLKVYIFVNSFYTFISIFCLISFGVW
jgi:starch synthase